MVYCGKPSKGCGSCRERKIRCDQAKPMCSQCARLDRKESECVYRNLLDLSFRNESLAVIEKANKPRPSPAPRPPKQKSLSAKSLPTRRASSARGVSARPADARAPVITDEQNSHIITWTANEPSHEGASSTASTADLFTDDDAWSWSWADASASYATDPAPYTFPTAWSTSSSGYDGSSPPYFDDASYFCSPAADYALSPPAEDVAAGYFAANFITPSAGPSRGTWTYLEDFSSTGPSMDPMVNAGMTAIFVGAMSNQYRSQALVVRARREYASALNQINAALRSPTEAVKDSTLLSIMILSVYETITASNKMSVKAWTEHLNGAGALIRLRGTAQFKTATGRGLFLQVLNHYLMSCIQREIPLPNDFIDLRKEAAKYTDTTEPQWQSVNSIIEFAFFRAAVRAGRFSNLKEIIDTAINMDTILARKFAWESLPPSWHYETVFTDELPEVVHNGCYHIYFDHFLTQIWNNMRTIRILLHEMIRVKLLEGFATAPAMFMDVKYSSQLQRSTEILIKLRDDILRSVPQQLGYVTRRPFSSGPDDVESYTAFLNSETAPSLKAPTAPTSSSRFSTTPTARAIGGYFLLWPLYISGMTRATTAPQRAWIMARLRYIGQTMGIGQADAIAGFLGNQAAVNLMLSKWKGQTTVKEVADWVESVKRRAMMAGRGAGMGKQVAI
ncbi:hypothetical protein BP6252_00788 [Coleophoma cylindrospora]|uniref:Zn(2)-C6 fungal-type domain-containing protein n=1 Tax=Coleophoma cylindrospora TaxID=1849047 RepID=A0A3D8SR19_9HELO|nr:hypothetical protein BP6252_00788 [Coleophoma cylindrospora]